MVVHTHRIVEDAFVLVPLEFILRIHLWRLVLGLVASRALRRAVAAEKVSCPIVRLRRRERACGVVRTAHGLPASRGSSLLWGSRSTGRRARGRRGRGGSARAPTPAGGAARIGAGERTVELCRFILARRHRSRRPLISPSAARRSLFRALLCGVLKSGR
jgi:hypothetical protein